MSRKGEKIGWIGGWSGGFIWLGLLSGIWAVQGKTTIAILGAILFIAAIATIVSVTPWKYPNTKYWKLMLPVYCLFFISIAFAFSFMENPKMNGLSWYSFFWVFPCLIPFWTTGSRTWKGEG
ncbi:MAG: hypothetical protein DRJ08_03750 [Acidobacteria bacterium]|nr:MAG: hypothetical protein DRJ08_03750 [Acidobacteriota bacterium]